MLVLGLDPSLTAFGWALHDDAAEGRARRPASGHEGTLPSSVPVARFLHHQEMVRDVLARHPVEAVGIESPAYDAGPFQTIHFGLMMFSLVPIFEARKDVVLFDPATLKYLARETTNKKGAMGKLDMQRKVQVDTMDTRVIDNNEADAYLVGKYAARMMRLVGGSLRPEDLTETERRVFLTREKTVKRMGQRVKKRVSHAFRENSRFFRFSLVPPGDVRLPSRSVDPKLVDFLDKLEPDLTPMRSKTVGMEGVYLKILRSVEEGTPFNLKYRFEDKVHSVSKESKLTYLGLREEENAFDMEWAGIQSSPPLTDLKQVWVESGVLTIHLKGTFVQHRYVPSV
jgi:hypothetical protein